MKLSRLIAVGVLGICGAAFGGTPDGQPARIAVTIGGAYADDNGISQTVNVDWDDYNQRYEGYSGAIGLRVRSYGDSQWDCVIWGTGFTGFVQSQWFYWHGGDFVTGWVAGAPELTASYRKEIWSPSPRLALYSITGSRVIDSALTGALLCLFIDAPLFCFWLALKVLRDFLRPPSS